MGRKKTLDEYVTEISDTPLNLKNDMSQKTVTLENDDEENFTFSIGGHLLRVPKDSVKVIA